MIIGILIGILLTLIAAGAAYFFVVRSVRGRTAREQEMSFEQFAARLFEDKIKNFMDIASLSFKEREEKVHRIFEQMQRELREHRDYTATLDKDRIKMFSELRQGLHNQSQLVERLRGTTEKLNNVLSNSRLRGQFGERIAEDILKATGLIEGKHYLKNKKQETVATRPDFTFLLPDQHRLNMDVKFPLENFSRMIAIDDWQDSATDEVSAYQRAFLKDIKEKIKEVSGREYINPKENTLDFVILFIPNERISSYIHETFPEVFDRAIENKVMIASPYTLISMVSMIRQAFQNFYQHENIRDILVLLQEFSQRYDLFKKRFEEVGTRIERSHDAYEAVAEKSFKMMDSTIGKIEKQQRGAALEEKDERPQLEHEA